MKNKKNNNNNFTCLENVFKFKNLDIWKNIFCTVIIQLLYPSTVRIARKMLIQTIW